MSFMRRMNSPCVMMIGDEAEQDGLSPEAAQIEAFYANTGR